MINKISIAIVLVIIITFLFFQFTVPNITRVVSVMEDVTDVQKATPALEKIESLFQLQENQWQGAVFRYSNLTDVSLNESKEKTLPNENAILSNEFERTNAVNDFSSFIKKALSEKVDNGRTHSSVYLPIARELQALKAIKADEKILIVYSDLMENEADLSMYNPKTFKQMFADGDSLKNNLEQQLPLPDLTGITIYLIYQPQNIIADTSYQVVSAFYKKLFGGKGAIVHIQANL